MTYKSRFRSGLLYIDNKLGIRDWLNSSTDNTGTLTQPGAVQKDPFNCGDHEFPLPKTILDIGGSHGQFVHEAMKYFPLAKVYSFEPIPECFSELVKLTVSYPNLVPYNLALSNEAMFRDFKVSRFQDSSSLHDILPVHIEAWPNTFIDRNIIVRTERLDDIACTLDLVKPIFTKIDVQGHELAVIQGGRKTLYDCQRVMLECNFESLYKDQPTFSRLYSEMKDLGFLFDGFISLLRHPKTAELLSADLVFYKE